MDKKRKDGYIAGTIFSLSFCILLIFTINNATSIGWNLSTQVLLILDAFCGILGFGSFWKPELIGGVASQILENLSRGPEGSDSHNKQIQKKSDGSVQVMASDQSNVHITVHSGKKKDAQNHIEEGEHLQSEKDETLRKETIVVAPSDGYFYEFDLMKEDHLKGEVASTSPVDVFFLDMANFEKWSRGRKYFEPEGSNDSVLETNIDYVATKKGKWYVIIENNGRKSATVKVRLY